MSITDSSDVGSCQKHFEVFNIVDNVLRTIVAMYYDLVIIKYSYTIICLTINL